MGLSNNTILEICNDTIASVESSEDNQGSLIMLSDIDFNHPELELFFKSFFYLSSECNSSLGWYYIRNNFLSTKSPALQKFASDLKVDSLLVSQITKSIVLNTVMKYPLISGKLKEERLINYNTYCIKYGFDTTIRDLCIDPKNNNIRQIEKILSNLNLLMGDFLIKPQSDKWLLKNFNDYLWELEFFKYKSSISTSDIDKALDYFIPGLSLSEKSKLMTDPVGVHNGLKYLDKIDSYHSAFRAQYFCRLLSDVDATI